MQQLRHTLRSRFGKGWRRMRQWLEQRPVVVLIALLGLTFAIDLIYIVINPPTPHAGETAHTWPVVLNLVHGQGYTACFTNYFPFCSPNNAETAQREPVPVLIFAGVAWLTRDSLLAATFVNIAVHLAVLVGIYWLIQMVASRRVALFGAALWATYLPATKMITSISGDLLAALWVVLAVGLLMRARNLGRWYDWAGAGLAVGVGALSRSAILILAPVFVIAVLLWPRKLAGTARRRLLPRLALFVCTFMLVLTPWVVRNMYVFDKPVFGSTLSGYNLFRQTYQLHSNNFLRYVDGPEAQQAVMRLLWQHEHLSGTENEAQVESVYSYTGLDAIEDHPRRYLALLAYRSLMLWFDLGVAASDRVGNGVFAVLIFVQQAILLMTASLSLRRYWEHVWPLVLGVGAVSVMYIAVNAMVRYLLPVMPLTIALSAIGAMLLWQRWFRHSAPPRQTFPHASP